MLSHLFVGLGWENGEMVRFWEEHWVGGEGDDFVGFTMFPFLGYAYR